MSLLCFWIKIFLRGDSSVQRCLICIKQDRCGHSSLQSQHYGGWWQEDHWVLLATQLPSKFSEKRAQGNKAESDRTGCGMSSDLCTCTRACSHIQHTHTHTFLSHGHIRIHDIIRVFISLWLGLIGAESPKINWVRSLSCVQNSHQPRAIIF